eukprot:CAMPEP_0198234064 /NCGR_PEP_ID=MMETSP1446-20131203/162_1 /TAXON_ID=1461542 ORGANISM="Unidentified sp, Strain CCMP2111" /NCGR_SAMPLE_ID=MMETSP1446 /ASSEMBLY_ACC=CAM_ASM_001112 /LENGTH=35 /DNA_ID= /DNA_START= /DNA_END= /DNA_ORIENTATION=
MALSVRGLPKLTVSHARAEAGTGKGHAKEKREGIS